MDRQQLDTAIEREVHKFIAMIGEHTYDFTHLYCRRNGIELDPQMLKVVLEIVKLAIKDGEMSKIQIFHSGIQKVLDRWTDEENPTLSIKS